MSTLQVANIHLESTANNRITYDSITANLSVYVSGNAVFSAAANSVVINAGGQTVMAATSNSILLYSGGTLVFSANAGSVTKSAVAKYGANIGNATNTTFTVSHNLNTIDVFVAIRENSSGYFVYPDIKYSTTNTVVLEFTSAPTTNQYYVSIIGA